MIKNKKSPNTPSNEDMAELESFYKKDELDSLISKARELIDKFPTNADLYNILGVGLQKKDLHDESILNFENAIRYRHDFDHAHNNLGNVKKAQGKLNEAAQSYKKATIINPNYKILHTRTMKVHPKVHLVIHVPEEAVVTMLRQFPSLVATFLVFSFKWGSKISTSFSNMKQKSIGATLLQTFQ